MPPECRKGITDAERDEIWVKGMYFAPAINIRRANVDLWNDRYIFQNNMKEEWEPALQYKAALGKCPELVMVTNCSCWHNTSEVLHVLPRVYTQKMYKPIKCTSMAGTGIICVVLRPLRSCHLRRGRKPKSVHLH
jgi:hypothetical protein